ncbi:MAG: ABC transporter ATP-binding protein, partial [Acidobacteria bacterium]|nr:ABC transporter ATP-binding protein [Acidobacteriota bacterium]
MFGRLAALKKYLYRYRVKFLWGGLALLLNNAIWILFPQVIGRAINDLNKGVTRHKIATYSLALIVIALSKGLFQYLMRQILIGVSREIEFDLRNDLFRHLESLSFSYYQRTRVGDIMARATNDLNAVRMLLGPAIMYTANTIVFTAGALAFMLQISPRLTMFAFLPLPAASILVQYFGRRIHERFERIQATFSDISARAQENFSGARLVRAYVQEEAEIELFETSNREYISRSLKLVRLIGMLWPTLEMLLGLAIILVLWLGGREVLLHRMQVGDFVAYNTYMVQLTWPVIALGWVINLFQRGTASLGRINEIFAEQPAITDIGVEPALQHVKTIRGDIEFRDLTFAYPAGGPVLRKVSLSIPAGTSLAIVGPTGSGKSTLVSLIPRIYDAAIGSVFIDGHPIRELPLATLRRHIGFVPQETFLFSTTIRENIAFGVEDASDASVAAAAEAASLAQDIETFPHRYATVVGERGLTLSGGQKQRTAIARAVIRNPRILVLDDALSSVDTYTEERILNHLR